MDNNYNGFNPNGNDAQQSGQPYPQAPVQQPAEQVQPQYAQPQYPQQPAEQAQPQYAQPQYAQPQYPQQPANNYAAPAPGFSNPEGFNAQPSFNDGNGGEVAVAKKRSKLPVIIGGAVVGVAGVSALLYAFVSPVRNWVKLTFMKPEKYFASVEEQAFSEYSTTLSEGYGQVVDMIGAEGGSGANYGLDITVTDKDKLIEMLADGEDTSTIPDFNLESLGIELSTASKDNQTGINTSVSLNGEDILSANFVMDMAEMMAYVQIPEISSAWLSTEITDGDIPSDEAELFSAYVSGFDTESLVSEDEFKRIVEDYANIVYTSIEAVEISKSEEVEVAGKDYKFNVMEYELTDEEIYDIAIALLKEAKKDDAVKDMFVAFGICDEDEYKDFIDEAIAEIEGLIDEAEGDTVLEAKVYVDVRGKVMGREYNLIDDDEETTVYYIIGADGEDICIEAGLGDDVVFEFSRIGEDLEGLLEVDGEKVLTIDGTYKKEAYSGTITLVEFDEDNDLTIGFSGLKLVNEEKGYIEGSVYLEEQDALADVFEELGVDKIEVVFSSDGDSQEISYDYSGVFTIKLTYSVLDDVTVDMPSDSDTVYDAETQGMEYLENADYEDLVDKLIKTLGLEDYITTEDVIAMIESEINGDYGDDWDDDPDPDYGDGEDDPDYDYEDTYDFDYIYFSDVTVDVFGTTSSLPCKAEPFCTYFDVDPDEMIEGYDYDWVYSDYWSEFDYQNPNADETRLGDCLVDYIYIDDDDTDIIFSVNGIGIGSSIDDINYCFNTDFSVKNGSVDIYDNDNSYNSITFYLENNAVAEITIWVDVPYDYEISDDDYDSDYYDGFLTYDYTSIKIDNETVNRGTAFILPEFTAKSGMTGSTVSAGGYIYNYEGTYYAEWTNDTSSDLPCESCPVTYFEFFADDGVVCSIDGVTFGTTIADAEAAFGMSFGENGDTFDVVFTTSDTSEIYLISFESGVVTYIAYSIYF